MNAKATGGNRRNNDRNIAGVVGLWIADILLCLALYFLLTYLAGTQPVPGEEAALGQTVTLTSTVLLTTETPAVTNTPPAVSPTGTISPVSQPTEGPASPSVATSTPTPAPMATDTSTPVPAATDTPTPASVATDTATPAAAPTNTATVPPPATEAPLPTYTPPPTLAPLPTYTLYPTLTPLPTYTPFPLPTSAIGRESEIVSFSLDTDADILLGSEGSEKTAERDRIRQQIREELEAYSQRQAGIVFTFGTSPRPTEGNRLAGEVNRILLEEFPEVFGEAVLRNYHIINGTLSLRGRVDLEIYFFIGTP